ncbi:hypothetical protein [Candidatus Protofrankia californiensis]|uniref:hypothetical protein n=1 Tax=Candidatus Protofrankia californiensis TaxID=1839754 RepID=UPI0010415D1C|nr:hypothetical protein [Candidatus Protofrankia californiensis]
MFDDQRTSPALYALVHLPDADPIPSVAEVVLMFSSPAEADAHATYHGYSSYRVASVTFAIPAQPPRR